MTWERLAFSTSSLVMGSHVINAIYPGDGSNYLATSYGVLLDQIGQDATTTYLVGTPPAATVTFGTVLNYTG